MLPGVGSVRRNKLGLFCLGNYGYAIPLKSLLRVVDGGLSVPLPLVPDAMAGMLVLDGQIIPLLDSNWLPGVEAGRGLSASFKVIITTEYGSVALPADATIGIAAEDRCERVTSGQECTSFFTESISYRDNLYQMLNTDPFIMNLIRPDLLGHTLVRGGIEC